MIRSMIVDDELPAREELKYLLGKYSEIEIVKEEKNGLDVLNNIGNIMPDVIFLDINMPKIPGIEVASKIIEYRLDKLPLIVFITAYDEYAIKAFELNAIDYLLKPIDDRRLSKTVDKLIKRLKDKRAEYEEKLNALINDIQNKNEYKYNKITLYREGAFYPIEIDNIVLATVEDKNTTIFTIKDKFIYHGTLTHLEKKINRDDFYRSHRSYLVNINYVEKIEPWFNNTYHIKMKKYSDNVPVSRGQVKEFKSIMNLI
ncbi:response regulator transcription factor [Clostridium sp. D2Q-14]|nr:response regulator transcription factor [Anaeromonas gelatinilytica]